MRLLCRGRGDSDSMSEHNPTVKVFPTMRANKTITDLGPDDLLFIPVKPSCEKTEEPNSMGVLALSSIKKQKKKKRVPTWITFIRHQKLRCPKHLHHLPAFGIFYHLLLRPVTSHLLCFLWTSLHLSAPEHQHTAFLFSRVSAICHFKCPLFPLKWWDATESKPAPFLFALVLMVHFEPHSPSLQGLFQPFNQQHWRSRSRQNPAAHHLAFME